MTSRVEWRSRSEGDEVILAIDDATNIVLHSWSADANRLADLLNDMNFLHTSEVEVAETALLDPEDWGELVIAREEGGDVLFINPKRYWDGIAFWFRSHGIDPHPLRGLKPPLTNK